MLQEDQLFWSNFDNNTIESFYNTLTSMFALFFNHEDPDMRVIEFYHEEFYRDFIRQMAERNPVVHLVVKNNSEGMAARCPYFRLTISNHRISKQRNHKLSSFLSKTGIVGISDYCDDVLVIGLSSDDMLGFIVDVPSCLRSSDIEDINMGTELDMACLRPCTLPYKKQDMTLADIPGMEIGRWLPWEVQMKIVSFCVEPTAQLIKNEMERIYNFWDGHLNEMYSQRTWREIPNSPYVISVPAVSDVIRVVARPYLAPVVLETVGVSLPPWSL